MPEQSKPALVSPPDDALYCAAQKDGKVCEKPRGHEGPHAECSYWDEFDA